MDRRQIMQTANWYLTNKVAESRSEALKLAWWRAKIVAKLQNGKTLFSYAKKSTGEERIAIGTRQGYDFQESRPDLVRYYDLQAEGIRCFLIQNFAR